MLNATFDSPRHLAALIWRAILIHCTRWTMRAPVYIVSDLSAHKSWTSGSRCISTFGRLVRARAAYAQECLRDPLWFAIDSVARSGPLRIDDSAGVLLLAQWRYRRGSRALPSVTTCTAKQARSLNMVRRFTQRARANRFSFPSPAVDFQISTIQRPVLTNTHMDTLCLSC